MEKIKEWLDSKELDYDDGMALLTRNCKNRILIQSLSRKQNPNKLKYELSKLLMLQKNPGGLSSFLAKPVKTEPIEKSIEELVQLFEAGKKSELNYFEAKRLCDHLGVKPASRKTEDVFAALDPQNLLHSGSQTNNSNKPSPAGESDETGKVRIKVIRNLKEKEVNYDDLPVRLQKLWDANTEMYKKCRSSHEKLKLMENAPAEDRQPLITEMCQMDDQIRANWEVIDSWDGTDEDLEERTKVEIDHKRINTNRKYISTNKEKLTALIKEDDTAAADKLRVKIQERVDELLQAKESFTDAYKTELLELGIEF